MSTQPDMAKVRAALKRYASDHRPAPDYRRYPPPPSPPARDAAIRKPLRAHGVPCCGFHCSHFLNNTD